MHWVHEVPHRLVSRLHRLHLLPFAAHTLHAWLQEKPELHYPVDTRLIGYTPHCILVRCSSVLVKLHMLGRKMLQSQVLTLPGVDGPLYLSPAHVRGLKVETYVSMQQALRRHVLDIMPQACEQPGCRAAQQLQVQHSKSSHCDVCHCLRHLVLATAAARPVAQPQRSKP